MNIIVVPKDKKSFYCRPDSTLIRALEVYYAPDYIEKISATPVLYVKTLRAGKAVAPRFVERYIDSYGFGLLLHPTLKDGTFEQNGDFIVNSLDYTSILPLKSFPLETPISEHTYKVTLNYKEIFETQFDFPSFDEINQIIGNISRYCSLRIGDFITFELTCEYPLEDITRVIGEVDGEQIFNFVTK